MLCALLRDKRTNKVVLVVLTNIVLIIVSLRTEYIVGPSRDNSKRPTRPFHEVILLVADL